MMYRRGSFTVPVSRGTSAMCAEKGHAAPDARGNCLCCGACVAQIVGVVSDVDPVANTITVSTDTPAPAKSQYLELLGGARAGDVISTDEAFIAGLDAILDGQLYQFVDVSQGILRYSHVGPA
jgi:hypothetical protein